MANPSSLMQLAGHTSIPFHSIQRVVGCFDLLLLPSEDDARRLEKRVLFSHFVHTHVQSILVHRGFRSIFLLLEQWSSQVAAIKNLGRPKDLSLLPKEKNFLYSVDVEGRRESSYSECVCKKERLSKELPQLFLTFFFFSFLTLQHVQTRRKKKHNRRRHKYWASVMSCHHNTYSFFYVFYCRLRVKFLR